MRLALLTTVFLAFALPIAGNSAKEDSLDK